MKKQLILSFLAGIAAVGLHAQQEDGSVFDHVFDRNHFSLSYNHGYSKPGFTPEYGEMSPQLRTGTVFRFDAEYTYNFSPQWGVSLSAGMGRFPLYVYDSDPFMSDSYAFLGRLSLGVNHRSFLSRRYVLQSTAALTLNGVGANYSSRSIYSFNGDGRMQQSYLQCQTNVMGVFLGAGISRVLKGGNMLTFKAGFHYAFSNFMEGDVLVTVNDEPEAAGNYYSSGHYPEVGLAYTFTGAKKVFKMNRVARQSDISDVKKVKRQLKIDDRKEFFERKFIITKMLGGNSVRPGSSGETGDFILLDQGGFAANLALEYNFKGNFFAEGGLGYAQLRPGTRSLSEDVTTFNISTVSQSRFDVYTASLGAGYRFVGSENYYNYLNLHAGVSVGYAPDMRTSESPAEALLNNTLENINADKIVLDRFRGQNQVFPMAYLGASKDFKVVSNLYFNVMYRYNIGMVTVYDLELISAERDAETLTGNAKIRSIGSMFQFGVRYGL